ncbi:flavodoxin family protein [Winogradskyella haliclonae]|uniref:NAD(P)H-dependent oxidoreductase n=1 Tax=Winogradskyella haliclonae TaxID=2048558 RepID=A0ABQ2BYN7_9FLAO|nr:NAD(P)H-dependent oxidoreductase [Winogradskyella haliclonae]GGI57634.1 NAD(P)H-dependent oxidoreductase [Winogradskyella haliclonae]
MTKRILIFGSSRNDGNTSTIVNCLKQSLDFDLINLNGLNISHFDYKHQNRDDDFLPLMRKVIGYQQIIFATPVYWYTMSGILKVFFDRLTDCLTIEKDLGRKLRNKQMSVLSTSNDDSQNEEFFLPFILSAEYLGMDYIGNIHTWLENEKIPNVVKNRITYFAKLHSTN